MLDLNVIPASGRSKAQLAAHLELYNRTMDTVRVHNPTEQDFVVHNDRRFTNEMYSIPNVNKDIGFGKGNNDVPRFIALRFVDKLGMELINVKIKEDWDKKKGKFRLEEQGVMEERLALRSSDPKLWEDITKKLWVGIVKRYQGEVFEDPEPRAPRKEYASAVEETLDRLEMNDAEIGVPNIPELPNLPDDPIDTTKESFIDQIS